MLYQYARLTNVLDGDYTNEIMVRHGQKEALDSQYKAWERHGPRVMRWVRDTLKIQGDDVAVCFKSLQMVPSFSMGHYHIEWELKNPNWGIFAVTRCKFLEEMDRAGRGFEKLICRDSEPKSFQMLEQAINPRIVVKPLKLPPRKSRDEIACRFEYRLERTA